MGVMACNRNGCDNIMCDRYSVKYGYICNSCFDELKTKYQKVDIEWFMDHTTPNTYVSDVLDEYFESEFPIR